MEIIRKKISPFLQKKNNYDKKHQMKIIKKICTYKQRHKFKSKFREYLRANEQKN